MRDMHLPENWNQPTTAAVGTRVLTSEPNGGSLTWMFNPDPYAVYWNLDMSNQINLTRGGQVTYAQYRSIGPLLIMGQCRSRADWLNFSFFLQDHQVEAQQEGISLRFLYPERDIDYSVYMRSTPQVGLDMTYGEQVRYQLVFDITRDHADLTTVNLSELGIPKDVGWIDVATAAQTAMERFPGVAGTLPPNSTGATAQDGSLNSNGTARSSNPPTPGRGAPVGGTDASSGGMSPI